VRAALRALLSESEGLAALPKPGNTDARASFQKRGRLSRLKD